MTRKLPTISGGTGPRFVRHAGLAACIDVRDESGEIISPDVMFERVGGASILVAPEPFRTLAIETSLARLDALGVRAIVSSAFEPHFYQKCIASGVLALPLEGDTVDAIAVYARSHPEAMWTIDLDRQLIERGEAEPLPFEVEPRTRQKLLEGLTDMEEMLRYAPSAAVLRKQDRDRRPWLYGETSLDAVTPRKQEDP